MSDIAIHEMISAYAAGCMDEKNYLYFRDHIKKGGELPAKELGELQNIMALLPLVLEEKKPAPEVKKNVAKELLKYSDEIKAKIQNAKTKTEIKPTEVSQKQEEPGQVQPVQNNEPGSDSDKMEVAVELNAEYKPIDLQEKLDERRERIAEDDDALTKRQWGLLVIGVVLLVSALVGLFYVYNLTTNRISDAMKEIKTMELEVEKNTEFRDNYFTLMQFFTLEDLKLVNLKPTNSANNYFGKFFVSFNSGSSLIKLDNMPELDKSQTYQLWARTDNRDVLLGAFEPVFNKQFTELNDIPEIDVKAIEKVFLTIELKPGSQSPSGRALLEAEIK